MDNARCITTVGGQVSFPRPSQPIFPFHLQHLQLARGFLVLVVFAANHIKPPVQHARCGRVNWVRHKRKLDPSSVEVDLDIRQIFAISHHDRAATHDEVRDRLVLDAALGTNLWAEEVQREEVDFVEEQEGGFAASVSVVLSLVRSDDGGHMHDETGSGREQPWRNPDPSPDAATATQRARVRALACARKRLAGRFWRSLDANVQRAVEDAARREVASRRRL